MIFITVFSAIALIGIYGVDCVLSAKQTERLDAELEAEKAQRSFHARAVAEAKRRDAADAKRATRSARRPLSRAELPVMWGNFDPSQFN